MRQLGKGRKRRLNFTRIASAALHFTTVVRTGARTVRGGRGGKRQCRRNFSKQRELAKGGVKAGGRSLTKVAQGKQAERYRWRTTRSLRVLKNAGTENKVRSADED